MIIELHANDVLFTEFRQFPLLSLTTLCLKGERKLYVLFDLIKTDKYMIYARMKWKQKLLIFFNVTILISL